MSLELFFHKRGDKSIEKPDSTGEIIWFGFGWMNSLLGNTTTSGAGRCKQRLSVADCRIHYQFGVVGDKVW